MSDSLKKQAEQHWRFFRQWMRAPLSTASVVPSSRHLARRMVAEVPASAKHVVELGAGTGVFTRALLDLPNVEEVMVVELAQDMYEALHRDFPKARVVHGDACALEALIGATGALQVGQVDAIISGLGLLNMPNPIVESILRASFSSLRRGAPFVQFTYGPKSPINDKLASELNLNIHRASFTLRNFPPASVYVARQQAVSPIS
jgi:phosphatidylethanolamine/phosphatidyl-N-methylethanolamine N-methyltransferase